jgi:hypothetical protein
MREVDQELLSRALAIVRRRIPAHLWDGYGEAIAADRRRREGYLRKPEPGVDRSLFAGVEALRSTGMFQLPCGLDPETASRLRRHIEALPVHDGPHTLTGVCTRGSLDEVRQRSRMAGYSMDQLLRTPQLVDILNRPAIVDLIERYLGCVPTLYSLNAWWSFPSQAPEMVNVQFFHRDSDDWRFCALFLFLTDIDVDAGPHQVINGSHTVAGMQRLIDRAKGVGRDVSGFDAADSFVNSMGEDFSNRCEQLFHDSIETVLGPAGTMCLVNTIALHRGLVPSRHPRLMIWARYGLGPNTNSADLEQGPLCHAQLAPSLEDTPRNRYINRLLFEFDRGPYDC